MSLQVQTETVPCALCRSRASVVLWREAPLVIRRCSDCGFVYMSPRPNGPSRAALYDDRYYRGYTEYEQLRLDDFRACFGELSPRPEPGRALDVGCGVGIVMGQLEEWGWDVTGVEPSTYSAQRARERTGATVHNTTLRDVRLPANHFDLVVVWDVLAHVPDPMALLHECARVTRGGGSLLLRTPLRSPTHFAMARLIGMALHTSAFFVHAPFQLHHFAPATLRNALAAAGYSPTFERDVFHPALYPKSLRGRVATGAFQVLRHFCARHSGHGQSVMVLAKKVGPATPVRRRQVRGESLSWKPEQLEPARCALCGIEVGSRACVRADGLPIARCPRCGLMFCNPRPKPDVLLAEYDEGYLSDEGGFGMGPEYVKMLKKSLASPDNAYRRLMGKAERLLGRKGRVLDVGCSAGFLLKCAEQQGWEPHGIDVSHEAVRLARRDLGLKHVSVGGLSSQRFPTGHFDVVSMQHVAEHFYDPVAELAEARRILKPHGILFIGVPNANSIRVLRGRWRGLRKSFEHLYYYTPATISAILERVGFDVIDIDLINVNPSISATRRLGSALDGRSAPRKVVALLKAARAGWRLLHRGLQFIPLRLGFSTSMWVWARKSPRPAESQAERASVIGERHNVP